MSRKVLFFLYFIMGITTLVFETLAIRQLTIVFGGTVYSISTILGAFMAGSAIGAFYFGRIVDKHEKPLFLYMLLLAGLTLFIPLFPFISKLIYNLHVNSLLLKFIINFCILLIPSSFIGSSLPVLTKILNSKSNQNLANSLAILYTVNNLGAVIGAFATGFVLLKHFGVTKSIWIITIINVIAVLYLFIKHRKKSLVVNTPEQKSKKSAEDESGFPYPKLILMFAFISGFTAFGYEILWVRSLSFLIGNTTIASNIMLGGFLFGFMMGAILFYVFFKSKTKAWLTNLFPWLSLFIFTWVLLSVKLLPEIFHLSDIIFTRLVDNHGTTPATLNTIRVISCNIMVLFPGICYGMIFIILNKLYNKEVKLLGSDVGLVSGINSLGCILGSTITGLVLLDALGIVKCFMILVGLNLTAGILVLITFNKQYIKLATVSVVALVLFLLIKPDFKIGEITREEDDTALLYYKEGAYGTVTVFEKADSTRILSINGTGEVPTDYHSILTFKMLGHIGFMINPNVENVLVNAFGGGIALGTAALHEKPIDDVEICADVLGGAIYYDEFNLGVLSKPNVNVIINDGRNHIKQTEKKYDVITADATHPGSGESWVLFTQEFYKDCFNGLNPGGVMIQWLPIHQIKDIDFNTVINTFNSVFKDSYLFFLNDYTLIVGAKDEIDLSYETIRKNYLQLSDVVKDDLRKIGFYSAMDFYRFFLLEDESIQNLARNGNLATDDKSFLEFAESRRIGISTNLENTEMLLNEFAEQSHPKIKQKYFTPEEYADYDSVARVLAHTMNLKLKNESKEITDIVQSLETIARYHKDISCMEYSKLPVMYLNEYLEKGFYQLSKQYPSDLLLGMYNLGIGFSPQNGILPMYAGVIHANSGDVDESMKYMNHALKLEPKNPLILMNSGHIHLMVTKDTSRAVDYYKQVLAIEPNHGQAKEYLNMLGAGNNL